MTFALSSRGAIGLLLTGLSCLFISFSIAEPQTPTPARGRLDKNIVTAALSFGHREFAWTMWALEGLASTVNLWHLENSTDVEKRTLEKANLRFQDFLKDLPEFAKEKIGMHEIFLFPTSYLAFVRNDAKEAVSVAHLGSDDPRLRSNLVLTAAYLTHILSDDLNAIAKEYEKVAAEYPQAKWLGITINKLKSGQDPFLDKDKEKTCKKLSDIFPFSRPQLVKRGICEKKNEGGTVPHD